VIRELERIEDFERRTGETGQSGDEQMHEKRDNFVRVQLWPRLDWLSAPSPDAELFGRENGGGFCRYFYAGITYPEMKLVWAKSIAASDHIIGGALPDDKPNLGQKLANYLRKIGVTLEELEAFRETNTDGEISEASRKKLAEWLAAGTNGYRDIRPAKPEEIEIHNALLRDRERHKCSETILQKWGFDSHGNPLSNSMHEDERERHAVHAWEEIRQTFERLGIYKGSLFDYEEELRASFVKHDSSARTSVTEES